MTTSGEARFFEEVAQFHWPKTGHRMVVGKKARWTAKVWDVNLVEVVSVSDRTALRAARSAYQLAGLPRPSRGRRTRLPRQKPSPVVRSLRRAGLRRGGGTS